MSEGKSIELLQVEDKVRRWLSDFVGTFETGTNILGSFRVGSARVNVDVFEQNDSRFLKVLSCVADGATSSPELFEYIARANSDYIFGRLQAADGDEEGLIDVWFEHNLLADYLDQEELKWAVGAVAASADDVDTEMVKRFGGRTMYEDDDD